MVLGRPTDCFSQTSHGRYNSKLAIFLIIRIRFLHQVLQVVELEATHAINLDIGRLHCPIVNTDDIISNFHRLLGYVFQTALILYHAKAQICRIGTRTGPTVRTSAAINRNITCQLTFSPKFTHSVLLDLLLQQTIIIDVS